MYFKITSKDRVRSTYLIRCKIGRKVVAEMRDIINDDSFFFPDLRALTSQKSCKSCWRRTIMSNRETELGTLIVVVLKARNLNDKHSLYKQDVFAQLTLNGENTTYDLISVSSFITPLNHR